MGAWEGVESGLEGGFPSQRRGELGEAELTKAGCIPETLRKPKIAFRNFPGGAVVKNLPANAGDTGSSPGPGRSHMPRSN